MKKIGIGILIGAIAIVLTAGYVYNAKYIDFEYNSGVAMYYNRLRSGADDTLFYRLNNESTNIQIYPFPDSLVQNLTPYVPYTGATTDLDMGLFDITTTDLTVTGNIYSGDSDYHYFGTGNNARLYFDGTQYHVEPAYAVNSPDTLQILFSNADSIFTADGNIKDWSGNGYDASLDSSYCFYGDDTNNGITFPAMTGANLLNGASTITVEFYANSDWVSASTQQMYIFNFENNLQITQYNTATNFLVRSGSDGSDYGMTQFSGLATGSHKYKIIFNFAADKIYRYRDDVYIGAATKTYSADTFTATADATLDKYLYVEAGRAYEGKIYDIKIYKDASLVFWLPLAEGSGTSVYDVISGTEGTVVNGGDAWDYKQNSFHYNIEYGFTDDGGVYYPYTLAGSPIHIGGTNHPAGNWHNGAETQICFNPLGVGAITTATGFTSTDFFTYAEIVDYIGSGTGDFTVIAETNKKSEMTTFAGSVSVPDAGFLATGKLHDPDAQLSNKSRGVTSSTYNLKLLNNSDSVLVSVADSGDIGFLEDQVIGSATILHGTSSVSVLIIGALVTDYYFVTAKAPALGTDILPLLVSAQVDSFIVYTDNADTLAQDLPFNWLRVKGN